jgi:hypothetical protein
MPKSFPSAGGSGLAWKQVNSISGGEQFSSHTEKSRKRNLLRLSNGGALNPVTILLDHREHYKGSVSHVYDVPKDAFVSWCPLVNANELRWFFSYGWNLCLKPDDECIPLVD